MSKKVAQMIVETTAEAATREDAQEVARAASRMERLLLDLLDVARIESRTLRIARADHGVCGFVTEVFRSYEPLFAAREITFRVESPGSDIVASFAAIPDDSTVDEWLNSPGVSSFDGVAIHNILRQQGVPVNVVLL